MSESSANPIPPAKEEETAPASTIEEAVAQAKRAFALRKFEQAVDHYATALEIMTKEKGDNAPEAADLYFSYGKALFENAVSQNAVLGKEEAEDSLIKDGSGEAGPSKGEGAPFLSFSGDGDEEDASGEPEEDAPVDLFAQAAKAHEEEEEEEKGGEEAAVDDGEPEDDFNAAWEVLDLARTLYSKQQDDDFVKLKLADTYIALGDVSLETENFDQAITDYTSSVTLKSQLLPFSSRQVAEAHYKLSIVLDLKSGKLDQTIEHAEKALQSVEARLAELRSALSGQAGTSTADDLTDPKGKGKAKASSAPLSKEELPQNMTKAQIESEIKELGELREDLALKVEELEASPSGETGGLSAPEIVAKSLDKELNAPASGSNAQSSGQVNDLTSTVVRKKKKATEGGDVTMSDGTNGAGKRKAEDEASSDAKKTKV
ncbi:hypothetical protein SCHPADRAFT_904877 [Schizopora paradoxa]|uniref:Tetratricopeptide SHNi-TPR domain-containing protein n=1 Tax=Schizopora paradoxa TaxID=27342 RepID=A0A0H2RTF8_9AGAM|nr:hypothetical protein SCHPADRAFT_904877 [Schizopora paradoxa]